MKMSEEADGNLVQFSADTVMNQWFDFIDNL